MKLLIGAAVAVLTFATIAEAQPTTTPATPTPPAAVTATASQCPGAVTAPAIPDGATVEPAAMQASNEAYRAWATAMQEVIRCRRAEYDQALANVTARRDEYNGMAESLNTTTTQWTAATATFCARPHMRCSNDQAGGTAGH